MSRRTGPIQEAVARLSQEISTRLPGAVVSYDPRDRYGSFDAVVTIIGSHDYVGTVPPAEAQELAAAVGQRYGVSLLVLYLHPQREGETAPTGLSHVVLFGPRHLPEAAGACCAEIERRLPGAEAAWKRNQTYDDFAGIIEVFGPSDEERDDQYEWIRHELFEAEEAIREQYGLHFLAFYCQGVPAHEEKGQGAGVKE